MEEKTNPGLTKNPRRLTRSMTFRIIGGTVFLLLLFGLLQSLAGYYQFTESLTSEYNESAFRTAETASMLVDGRLIKSFLETGGDSDEYRLMKDYLDTFCQKQNVTLIYVIDPDRTDYANFTAVVSVENRNSNYAPWEIGHRQATTNGEYREIYRQICEEGLNRGFVVRTSNLRGKEPHVTSLVPIRDNLGNVTAILCVQRPMSELKSGRARFLFRIALVTLLLAALSCASAYIFLRRSFVRPVKILAKEAERFAAENTEAEEGTLTDISTITEINDLGASILKMETDTLDHISRLTNLTAEKKQIGTELFIASRIQTAILPNKFPPFPDRHEFEIYASMSPAKEVGGDFYDFFLIDEDHLGLVMADVSGKGIPAALLMMVAKLLLKLRAAAGGTVGEMLSDVNATLCEKDLAEQFVTVWFAVLQISTGQGFAANAGHEHPALCRAGGGYELVKYRHAMPVAAIEGLKYREHEFLLHPGDSIFVYTDGVTEACDPDRSLFGEARLLEALNRDPDASPETVLSNVRCAIDEFVKDAEQFDDITMMGFKYNGPA
ncbi:MAG: PP2C family protein-serine/threonine phosphatase [Lachnospiraceae bacterium]|nr:PP2C family protein-serine/threonine phosphatase [Lachnospiraceae bacterium]